MYLHIRRNIETINKNSIFGEEDIMKGGRVRSTTTVARTTCWLLEISKDVYNAKVKDCVKKLKEAKAVFISNWIKEFDHKLVYEKVKEFILKEFKEVMYPKGTQILTQGEKSKELIFIKDGSFTLSKATASGKQSKILIISPGSVVGEDAFCYSNPNSYSLT